MTGPAVPPGRCGAQAPNLAAGGPPVFCSLRAGHAGWHEDEGASWTGSAVPSDEELREAVARNFAPTCWLILLERHRDRLRARADAILAMPEMAALIADAERVRRVRELADDDAEVAKFAREREAAAKIIAEQNYWHTLAGVREQSAERLRQALDGTP